tara:strand:+ start:2905 stop:3138 length:234 start_codon:yes stop_codon:yes gene_type:complete
MDTQTVFQQQEQTTQNTESFSQTPLPSNSLSSIEVKDENVALNLLVSYLHLAQKRGAFNLQESAKIWECVKLFTKEE